jgi:RNA polymerase sigma-70 factor, ECF subfamily
METARDRFSRLLEPVHDRAVTFARGLCRSRSDGDDLYQEALVRAFARLDSLRDDGAFRTWLFRIVVTVHRNHTRSAFWRRWLPFRSGDDELATEGDYRSHDWSPELAESARRARRALATLPAVQREAIVMFEVEGMLVDEIAAIQNVSISAVKSRLARGRERMRAFYDGEIVAVPEPIRGEST